MTQNSLYIRIIYSIMLIIYNDILYIVYIACCTLDGTIDRVSTSCIFPIVFSPMLVNLANSFVHSFTVPFMLQDEF